MNSNLCRICNALSTGSAGRDMAPSDSSNIIAKSSATCHFNVPFESGASQCG
jgi:hypothetical protein